VIVIRKRRASFVITFVLGVMATMQAQALLGIAPTEYNPFARRPSITFMNYKTREDSTHAVFRLKNRSLLPLSYSGYGETPQLRYQSKTAAGWDERGWDWCGTGLGKQYLMPGESVTFDVYVDDPKTPMRVGAYFSPGAIGREFIQWSSPTDVIP